MSEMNNHLQVHPESEQNSLASTPPEPSAAPADNHEEVNTTTPEDAESIRKAVIAKVDQYLAGVNPEEMLNSLVGFLRNYLVAEEYQLNILALWIVHTRCFNLFSTTAYLDIRSPEAECGKSRCLELLRLLCDEPWYA